jgi:hypothetical protein
MGAKRSEPSKTGVPGVPVGHPRNHCSSRVSHRNPWNTENNTLRRLLRPAINQHTGATAAAPNNNDR